MLNASRLARQDHGMALLGEPMPKQSGHSQVIFDHQYPHERSPSS